MTLHEDMTLLKRACDQLIDAITQPGKEHPMKKPCVTCLHSSNLHVEGECVMCTLLAHADKHRMICAGYNPPTPWWSRILTFTKNPKNVTR